MKRAPKRGNAFVILIGVIGVVGLMVLAVVGSGCAPKTDTSLPVEDRLLEGGGMVAAGALVTPGKVVAAGEVWAGMPAKFMRAMREDERAQVPYLVAHYKDLAKAHGSKLSRESGL